VPTPRRTIDFRHPRLAARRSSQKPILVKPRPSLAPAPQLHHPGARPIQPSRFGAFSAATSNASSTLDRRVPTAPQFHAGLQRRGGRSLRAQEPSCWRYRCSRHVRFLSSQDGHIERPPFPFPDDPQTLHICAARRSRPTVLLQLPTYRFDSPTSPSTRSFKSLPFSWPTNRTGRHDIFTRARRWPSRPARSQPLPLHGLDDSYLLHQSSASPRLRQTAAPLHHSTTRQVTRLSIRHDLFSFLLIFFSGGF
jgi:hypothetical protein